MVPDPSDPADPPAVPPKTIPETQTVTSLGPPVTTPAKVPTDEEMDAEIARYLDGKIAVPKEDFARMQKQLMDLQTSTDEADKVKEELNRKYLFNELKRLKPQLAKIHEKSSSETLKIVISTAKEMDAGFPSLDKDKDDPKKASEGDHDVMDYDFDKRAFYFQ